MTDDLKPCPFAGMVFGTEVHEMLTERYCWNGDRCFCRPTLVARDEAAEGELETKFGHMMGGSL